MSTLFSFRPTRGPSGDSLTLLDRAGSSFTPAGSRSFGLAAAVAMIFVGPVSMAADMPTKAAQPSLYQWSGCYVGANIGGGASGSNFDTAIDPGTHLFDPDRAVVAASGSGSHGGDGLLAGAQVGCNLQSGLLVAGLEGDFDYFHSNPWFSNNTNTLIDGVTPFTITQSVTTKYLATVRPRIGIAADRNLAYLTAGVAFTRVSYLESYSDGGMPPGAGSAAASKSLVGWVAGAGWEYAMTDHWIFRAEYLYASFSKVNAVGAITDTGGGANELHGSSELTTQALRAGVNYKF
ncbi:MAG: porin family protein [Bradyrhizobium sp.]|nr:porin family protein [Bradyrhizobium sp.]